MAIRKSAEEQLTVEGGREEWLGRVSRAFDAAGFKKVEVNPALGQATGKYKSFRVVGDLKVTLRPVDDTHTGLHLQATANVDNVFALGSSPNQKILGEFKKHLTT